MNEKTPFFLQNNPQCVLHVNDETILISVQSFEIAKSPTKLIFNSNLKVPGDEKHHHLETSSRVSYM